MMPVAVRQQSASSNPPAQKQSKTFYLCCDGLPHGAFYSLARQAAITDGKTLIDSAK